MQCSELCEVNCYLNCIHETSIIDPNIVTIPYYGVDKIERTMDDIVISSRVDPAEVTDKYYLEEMGVAKLA